MRRITEVTALTTTELRLHALFVQGIDGDTLAYRLFLQATAPHLRAFLRRRLRAWPDEVEDLVQESLLAIHNQRLSYDSGMPLTSWMHAIARYKLIDWLRRHGRRDGLHDAESDENALFSSADEEAGEARRDLGKLLATLPRKQHMAIRYTKLDGLSMREAASALQMTEVAVKVAVHRGLKALASALRDTTMGNAVEDMP